MLTDVKMSNLRVVLHQIYVNLYVEYGMLDLQSFYITREKLTE